MTLDILHFTPGMSLLGGLLIGTASALFILANGRIAGISGILGGLLRPTSGDVMWRLREDVGCEAEGECACKCPELRAVEVTGDEKERRGRKQVAKEQRHVEAGEESEDVGCAAEQEYVHLFD